MNKNQHKINYNIDLVKSVFKSNQKSLIQLSEQNIELIKIQNEDFIKRLSKNSNPDKNENFESLAEESSHLSNIDWIFLNSIFISAFSHFEIQLYKIANITEVFINNIKIKDISGKGIFQYRKFLEIIALLENGKKDNRWNEIDNYQKVRNKLVHNGGIIITDPSKKNDLEKDAVYKFLKNKEVPVYGSLGSIRIKNIDFIKNFSDLTIGLSDSLIQEIKVKY